MGLLIPFPQLGPAYSNCEVVRLQQLFQMLGKKPAAFGRLDVSGVSDTGAGDMCSAWPTGGGPCGAVDLGSAGRDVGARTAGPAL